MNPKESLRDLTITELGVMETKSFIATARGFWKAIGELADIERKHGDSFQKEACAAMESLQKILNINLEYWNQDMASTHHPIILECSDASICAHLGKCEIYITEAADEEGRCHKCVEQKRIHDSWEHAR